MSVRTSAVSSEYPVTFQAKENTLVGILTVPRARVRDTAVVLTTGGAYIPSANRNRLSVRMAQQLAAEGFHVLRFDYHGVGESTGDIDGYRLDQPFADDLEAAVAWLRDAGLGRFVLVGSCFGARTILATAERITGLVGAVLISTPPRDFEMGDNLPVRFAEEMSLLQLFKKAIRPRSWLNLLAPRSRESYLRTRRLYTRTALMKGRSILRRVRGDQSRVDDQEGGGRFSPLFLRQFRRLVHTRIPILMLYGNGEYFYTDFCETLRGPLSGTVPDGGRVDIQTLDGVIHGFTTVEIQDAVISKTVDWIRQCD
jgi:pimeloyl-ACP methyl ester carboxylesterase